MNSVSVRPNLSVQLIETTEMYFKLSVNGQTIAVFDQSLTSDTDCKITTTGNLIFLGSIQSKGDLTIEGKTIIALDHLRSETGIIHAMASGRMAVLGGAKSHGNLTLSGDKDLYVEPCSDEKRVELIRFFREAIASGNEHLLRDFILSVCELATPESSRQAIEGNPIQLLE